MTNLIRVAMLVVLLVMGMGATEGANAKQVWAAGGELLDYDPRKPPKPEEPKEPEYRTLNCKYFVSIPAGDTPYWQAGNYYVVSLQGWAACPSWYGYGQLVASWWS